MSAAFAKQPACYVVVTVTVMAPGRAVQIITVESVDHGRMFRLNETALCEILLQDNIKDLPVAVVSVAGKMRQGKSFFLNFFIQYLKNKLVNTDEYALLEGFEWRSGPESCTTGILIWSEVFVVEGPSGKKIAVLLMDTQGTFDTNTTMKECSTVFALSTMLSSIQIYNLMNDVKRDDLDSLRLFVEYGKTAQSQGFGTQPFKSLLFLVRDWSWLEHHPLGATGGADFINSRLINMEDIRTCFEDVSCFLLPYPWKKVETDREALVNLSGITDNFKTLMRELLSGILNWSSLENMVKDLDGEQMRVQDILKYFKAYIMIFEGDKIPTPQSAFDANVLVSTTSAYEKGIKTFDEVRKSFDVSAEDSPSQDSATLLDELRQCQELAISEFKSRAKLGSNVEVLDNYLAKMYEDTDTIIDHLVHLNNVKKKNEEAEVKIIEAAHERAEAERKVNDANIKEQEALRAIEVLTMEKKEAENQRLMTELSLSQSEGKNSVMRREFEEQMRMVEELMENAKREIREAKAEKKEANRIMEEAETKRNSAEEKKKENNTATVFQQTGRVICDVVTSATAFLPGYWKAVGLAIPFIKRWF